MPFLNLLNHFHQIKAQKLDQLIGPQNTSDSSPEILKTAISIPEKLPLSDSFIFKKIDEFSVKQDLKKSFAAFNWKLFFHDKEDDSSNKDSFETLQIRKSKWTPPEVQFTSLDFFIKKYRHDIKRLK